MKNIKKLFTNKLFIEIIGYIFGFLIGISSVMFFVEIIGK